MTVVEKQSTDYFRMHRKISVPNLIFGSFKNASIATITESIAPGHHLLLFPSTFPRIRTFSRELNLCIMCPNWDNLSLVICDLSEDPGLICLMNHWFVGYPWYSQEWPLAPKFKGVSVLLWLPYNVTGNTMLCTVLIFVDINTLYLFKK